MALAFKVKLSLNHVMEALKGTGKNYVTVRELSAILGVSSKTAGRLMARLEREGYIKRYSNKAYKLNNNLRTANRRVIEESLQIPWRRW